MAQDTPSDARKVEMACSLFGVVVEAVKALSTLWDFYPELDVLSLPRDYDSATRESMTSVLNGIENELQNMIKVLKQRTIVLQSNKAKAYGLVAGDKIKARWYNDPKWYEGVLEVGEGNNLGFSMILPDGSIGWESIELAHEVQVIEKIF